MIYFFNSSGDCIQKIAMQGDAIELAGMATRHMRAMESLNCTYYEITSINVPMENMCLFEGRATQRISNPATASVSARLVTFGNLPNPCTIVINDTPYVIANTDAVIDLVFAGTYRIIVRAIPYLDANFTVTVA